MPDVDRMVEGCGLLVVLAAQDGRSRLEEQHFQLPIDWKIGSRILRSMASGWSFCPFQKALRDTA
jgi:hypothetical protein